MSSPTNSVRSLPSSDSNSSVSSAHSSFSNFSVGSVFTVSLNPTENPTENLTPYEQSSANSDSNIEIQNLLKDPPLEDSKKTMLRTTMAATSVVFGFNLSSMTSAQPQTQILSGLCITLGSILAFPPSNRYSDRIVTLLPLGIAQISALNEMMENTENLSTLALNSVTYSLALAILWNYAHSQKLYTQKTCLRRSLGAVTAVTVHKLFQALLPTRYAVALSTAAITAGSFIAFFPGKMQKKTWIAVSLLPLSAVTVSTFNPSPLAQAIISTISGIASNAILWYEGRRDMLQGNLKTSAS